MAPSAADHLPWYSLYDDDKLDLTVEIETLKQICRQDGLLAEDVVQIEDGEQNITLSL